MRVVRGSAALERPPRRAVLTIGNFDGIHIGHRAILRTVTDRARTLDGEAVVYTFDPHPRKVLQGERAPGLLTTTEQKLELLAAAQIDLVVLEPFTPEFARTSPEAFVRECVHARVAPREVYVGYDFHFGRDREGSMRTLTELGPRLGFAVTIVAEVTIGSRDVSSTRIRERLAEGSVEEAALLLGRPYAIRGRVVRGDQRGRTLGFPTANVAPETEVLPGHGVYAGRVRLLDDPPAAGPGAAQGAAAEGAAGGPAPGASFAAVTNVGRRPTFKPDDPPLAEAHLLDFAGDLYGRRIEVSFEARLRDERRFAGPDALREQIARDVAEARRRLADG
jgi:riboflavin kinase/FMN adenylyltransferase